MMSAELQQETLEMMLQNKPIVSIQEALNAINTINTLMQKRDKRPSTLTLKYQVRLHVRSAA